LAKGSDAARYLEFQRLVLQLLFWMSLIAGLTVLPANMLNPSKSSEFKWENTLPEFGVTTVQNMPADSAWLWVHCATTVVFSFVLYYFVFLVERELIYKYSGSFTQSPTSLCAAVVDGAPASRGHPATDTAVLESYFRKVSNFPRRSPGCPRAAVHCHVSSPLSTAACRAHGLSSSSLRTSARSTATTPCSTARSW